MPQDIEQAREREAKLMNVDRRVRSKDHREKEKRRRKFPCW